MFCARYTSDMKREWAAHASKAKLATYIYTYKTSSGSHHKVEREHACCCCCENLENEYIFRVCGVGAVFAVRPFAFSSNVEVKSVYTKLKPLSILIMHYFLQSSTHNIKLMLLLRIGCACLLIHHCRRNLLAEPLSATRTLLCVSVMCVLIIFVCRSFRLG